MVCLCVQLWSNCPWHLDTGLCKKNRLKTALQKSRYLEITPNFYLNLVLFLDSAKNRGEASIITQAPITFVTRTAEEYTLPSFVFRKYLFENGVNRSRRISIILLNIFACQQLRLQKNVSLIAQTTRDLVVALYIARWQ